MIAPAKGILLIANPFLKDPNFSRTVILICEHLGEGSFGFVLNKPFPKKLNEIVSSMDGINFPVFYGGPVQRDSLHFLHQNPDLITGGEQILENVYWGGNFESLLIQIKNDGIDPSQLRFFLGYSGWTEGQLDQEMKEGSWLTVKATPDLIFRTTAENIWKESLNHLGGEYKMLINYPIDPQLN
jgi:putative transcriptional regulator